MRRDIPVTENLAAPRPEALPAMLRDIAERTNVEIAIAIARGFGGLRLNIPLVDRLERDHPLARLVGHKAAKVIASHWGGDRYKIPSARSYLRWHDARQYLAEGRSRQWIAKKMGINYDQVLHLTAGLERPEDADGTGKSAVPSCPTCGRRRCGPKVHAPVVDDARQMDLFDFAS
jgi:hypothetical protein